MVVHGGQVVHGCQVDHGEQRGLRPWWRLHGSAPQEEEHPPHIFGPSVSLMRETNKGGEVNNECDGEDDCNKSGSPTHLLIDFFQVRRGP